MSLKHCKKLLKFGLLQLLVLVTHQLSALEFFYKMRPKISPVRARVSDRANLGGQGIQGSLHGSIIIKGIHPVGKIDNFLKCLEWHPFLQSTVVYVGHKVLPGSETVADEFRRVEFLEYIRIAIKHTVFKH